MKYFCIFLLLSSVIQSLNGMDAASPSIDEKHRVIKLAQLLDAGSYPAILPNEVLLSILQYSKTEDFKTQQENVQLLKKAAQHACAARTNNSSLSDPIFRKEKRRDKNLTVPFFSLW